MGRVDGRLVHKLGMVLRFGSSEMHVLVCLLHFFI